jgi:ferritin-like metal-binding protein YciE
MTTRNERLLQWLSDAHSMEKEAETMLKAQASRIENYPDLRQRIERHVEETQDQARRLEACIERLGGSRSAVKDTFGSLMATMHAAGNSMMSDEVVKGSGLSYAFEHLEIATYRALVVAARAAGDEQTAQVCEGILAEEQAMADWLEQHLDQTTLAFLQRDEADVQAKR